MIYHQGRVVTRIKRSRVPRAIISRYIKKIAQLLGGDFERRFLIEDNIEVSIIRLTPGYIQVILIISVYDTILKSNELSKLNEVKRVSLVLYEVLCEKAGLVAEVRFYLGHGLAKFYVWFRKECYVRLLLKVIKDLYKILKGQINSMRGE